MAMRTRRPSHRDELLQAIKGVHSAGLDAELWPDAMRSLTSLFGAVGATLEIFDKSSMVLRDFRAVGLPSGAETPYIDYYARHNPRAAYALRNLSEKVLFDYRLIDERQMNRDPYYSEYLRSIGLRYFLTGQIVDNADLHGVLSIQRSPRQGHVARRDLDLMRRVLPHLSQAYEMGARLRDSIGASHLLERALDWLSDGVLLVRGDGKILYLNDAMRSFLRRDDGIRVARGYLDFTSLPARAAFQSALAAIARIEQAAIPADFAADRNGDAPPYLVCIRPLHVRNRGASAEQAQAIVFIHDPLARNLAGTRLMQDLFGLTKSEADLAQALHSGMTVSEYAGKRELSLNTVYTHLRRIKEKTGCRRQAELIGKLNDLQLPLRIER